MFATAFRRLARAPSHLYGSVLAGGVVLGAALSARPADAEKNTQTGADFKAALSRGEHKIGLFVNSHSSTVAEMLSRAGYDWLLIDTQHGPMDREHMGIMISAVHAGGCKCFVRVGIGDRDGIQQCLDQGADGILVPYINNASEAREAVSAAKYPTTGTRSVYFPQRCMNDGGLLGYAGNANNNCIIALQVETADCIRNMEEIAAIPGVDMLFLGQNDLCMSMGLYEKYEFPHMYTSPELNAATTKLIYNARKNGKILGLFLFGTDRVKEFMDKGFTFISVGNDLHCTLTQSVAHLGAVEAIPSSSWKHTGSGINP